MGEISSQVQLSPSPKQKTQVSKRKVMEKKVVKVKIGANGDQKLKNEFPPPDSWSWRKYGQKPIKGSPFPRGYYRCSTVKGCSAKKQVERSREDASMVIITYTSGHNHPGPATQSHSSPAQHQKPTKPKPKHTSSHQAQSPPPPPEAKTDDQHENAQEGHFHEKLEEPYFVTLENKSFQDEKEKAISWCELIKSLSSAKPSCGTTENEFFDELGELPNTATTPASFTSFMRSSLFDERMVASHPS